MIERRKSVRIPAKLAMEIKISGSDSAAAESINVSANGVYFSSRTFIPVLTKLEVNLSLPAPAHNKSRKAIRLISCEGVVVRTEPEQEQPGVSNYEIACYFTSINAKDKDYLDSYILKQVPL
jgi:c-di-GMP-binding flagellar brake protein YcgR